MWKTFTDCFNCLPVAAIVDEKIFCCHGGLSPELQQLDQIKKIVRPTDVPDTGLLCDLLWSDPDKDMVNGNTPMYTAAQEGHTDALRLLLGAKADPDKAADIDAPIDAKTIERARSAPHTRPAPLRAPPLSLPPRVVASAAPRPLTPFPTAPPGPAAVRSW